LGAEFRGGSGHAPWKLALAFVALLVLTLVNAAWPLWRAFFQIEIRDDEAWNAYHADDVLHGRSLYPPAGSLITNNYPPLSFHALAALARLGFGGPVYAGRFLSIVALGVTAFAVASCVRALGGSRFGGAVAGAWFVGTMVTFFTAFVGANEPHLVGLAITVSALAWLLHRQRRARSEISPVLLMALAGFYKHTLIATPAAALAWTWLGNRGAAVRAFVAGLAAAALGLLVCTLAFGTDFLHQIIFYPRAHRLRWMFGSLGHLQWVGPALAVALYWAWQERRTAAARFVALYIGASLASFLLQKVGGIGSNAQFELVAATAIGLGLAFDRIGATAWGRRAGAQAAQFAILLIVTLRILLSNHVEGWFVLTSADYRREFREHARITAEEVARVSDIPGDLSCSVASVCRWAGKPFVFDVHANEQRALRGEITEAQYEALIRDAGIKRILVDVRTTADSLDRKVFPAMR
jgi:hypothetical protein